MRLTELTGCHPSFILPSLPFSYICSGLLSYVLLFNTQGEGTPDQVSWKKLEFIPEKHMSRVIGRNGEKLHNIEQKTGATLKVWGWNGLHIKGSPENQMRAIREIKELVVSLATKEFIQ